MVINTVDGTLDPAISLALRCFLALVFARALSGKLRDVDGFARTIRDYELLPERISKAIAASLLALEVVLVPALLIPASAAMASLAAAVVFGIYCVAIGVNLSRGRRDIDCGCAGPAASQPLHELLLARNAVFITLAVIAALPMTTRPMLWLDLLTVATAAASLYALAVATDGIAALAARSRSAFGVGWASDD